MNLIWDKLTEWLKNMLVGGIMDALAGLFDNVNEQIAGIAGNVGATPQAWNGSIFAMVRGLSDNVVVPVAGVILALVATLELVQMLVDRNNMHDFDLFLLYAVNCTLSLPDGDRREVMFWVAVFSRCSWMLGAVLGGVMGQLLPSVPEGIDFCMTALFVIIFMDQWEQARSHVPAVIGLSIGVVCLLLFGENQFILPALLIVSALLVLLHQQAEKGDG